MDLDGTIGGGSGAPARAPAREKSLFMRALSFVKPERKMWSGAVLLSLAVAALNAVEPLIFMLLFDKLAAGDGFATLGLLLVGLFAIGLVREITQGGGNWLAWRSRLNLQHRLLSMTVGRLHNLPVSYHRQQGVGDLMTRLDRAIGSYVGALATVVTGILPSILYLVMALYFMFTLDWRLSVLVLVFAPLPALIGAWAAKEQTERERTLLTRWGKIYSRFNEVMTGIVTVKSFVMEDAEKRRFLTDVDHANETVSKGVARDTTIGGARNLVALVARVGAIAAGAFLVARGDITIGVLLAFLGYLGGLFGPVEGLTGAYQTVRKARASLEVIYGILDAPDEVEDAPDARDVPHVEGDVRFEDVKFGYGGDRRILNGVTLTARSGEMVALVGPSGAGKSTVMALLQRFHNPDEGRILVDGQEVRSLKQKSLRQHVGVVLQDALVFDDTVHNVIAYGRPDASRAEVEAAARAANAHDFIMRLPEGYDTRVGERGGRLSVGERQRVAIARALLKDPRILILDEATSALDAESEALVQEALKRLVKGRTTFVIAHRLSTVVDADRICVLKDGQVVESGSHRDLVTSNGYYAELVAHQTKGLLPDALAVEKVAEQVEALDERYSRNVPVRERGRGPQTSGTA